jgi:hypothetical protein
MTLEQNERLRPRQFCLDSIREAEDMSTQDLPLRSTRGARAATAGLLRLVSSGAEQGRQELLPRRLYSMGSFELDPILANMRKLTLLLPQSERFGNVPELLADQAQAVGCF